MSDRSLSVRRGPERRLKRSTALATATVLFAGTAALASSMTSASAATTNLLVNSGFESGNLSGWSCSTLDSVVSTPVHSGSYALEGAASSGDDAQCTQTVTVLPSTTYNLSGYVQGAYVYLGATGTGVTASAWTPSASTWDQLSTSFTTGASTTSVQIYTHGWYGEGTYFADDISLSGPGGSGSPTASAPASSRPRRRRPRRRRRRARRLPRVLRLRRRRPPRLRPRRLPAPRRVRPRPVPAVPGRRRPATVW
ncbi:hypothetical protein GXW82_26995 [Streptacidiphilus sp. 4-A2]|nr:hypothetical protein [Streptacidiphilus sp. 4-A2]